LRLLIDENLSPRLARWACDIGIPAEAAVHVGLAGAADEDVFAHAEAGLNAEEQWLRVQSAIQLINQSCDPDMVNRVLEVQSDVVVRWHEIPAS